MIEFFPHQVYTSGVMANSERSVATQIPRARESRSFRARLIGAVGVISVGALTLGDARPTFAGIIDLQPDVEVVTGEVMDGPRFPMGTKFVDKVHSNCDAPVLRVNDEIAYLTDPSRQADARYMIERWGHGRSAADRAQNWAAQGLVGSTADYLALAGDLTDSEKAGVMALAYRRDDDNYSNYADGIERYAVNVAASYRLQAMCSKMKAITLLLSNP